MIRNWAEVSQDSWFSATFGPHPSLIISTPIFRTGSPSSIAQHLSCRWSLVTEFQPSSTGKGRAIPLNAPNLSEHSDRTTLPAHLTSGHLWLCLERTKPPGVCRSWSACLGSRAPVKNGRNGTCVGLSEDLESDSGRLRASLGTARVKKP